MDVSADKRMKQAHPELVVNQQYHAFVGGALSDHRTALGIEEVRKNTSRGSLWERRGRVERSAPNVGEDLPETTTPGGTAVRPIGPQNKKDKPFAARMRLHQRWMFNSTDQFHPHR